MIRKYHNHKLQANPQHLEEEPKTTTVTKHPKTKKGKQLNAKLERT